MLDNIKKCITEEKNLGKALKLLRSEIDNNNRAVVSSRLEEIENNYRLMCDYMLRGFKDPQRDRVYNELLNAAYRIYNSIKLYERIRRFRSYSDAHAKSKGLLAQPEQIYTTLEGFVQEIALSSLELENVHEDTLHSTYSEHQQYISTVFNEILVSDQWADNTRDTLLRIITSPTIDANDAQMIVSAITLACLNIFDINKWATLASAYENATNEKVRQRALVGWALSTPKECAFGEIENTLSRLCANDITRKELLEFQFQLYYCNNTDADNEKIKHDIMPNLIKNNNFEITRTGIIEKDDDPMRDILDSGEAERELEEMEKSFNRMIDMQKSGSDIYFGGFAQMKRFPFFYHLSNWFCPFYIDHPQLSNLKKDVKDSPLFTKMFSKGPFCESDKYSFMLALSSVFDSIPANVKELLNNPDSSIMGFGAEIQNTETPVYIRRMYLQDLYRFFRLNQYKEDFVNPFVNKTGTNLFLATSSFRKHLSDDEIMTLDKFLFKHKEYHDVLKLADTNNINKNYDHLLLVAISNIKTGKYEVALRLLNIILENQPDNEQALKSMAQLSFILHDYKQSVHFYQRLHTSHPENKSYALNLGIAQVSCDKTDEGMSLLFKLSFEHPDDININRALSWGYLIQGRPDNAIQLYEKIINSGNDIPSDYLNAGYAQYFLSNIKGAISLFRKYISLSDDNRNIFENFKEDEILMKIYNISMSEQMIIMDLIDN